MSASAAPPVPMLEALEAADGEARAKACKALGRLGEAIAGGAAGPLSSCLKDPEVEVRKQALRALGKLGLGAARAATGAIIECLDVDADPGIRALAARTLGDIVKLAAAEAQLVTKTKDALMRHLTDGEAEVCTAAAGALGRMGASANPDVAEALAFCLNDENQGVRVSAAGALGSHLTVAVGALVLRLGQVENSIAVRRRAVSALGRMGDVAAPLAAEPLARLWKEDCDMGLRAEAALALSQMGQQALLRSSKPNGGLSQDKPLAKKEGLHVRHASNVEVCQESEASDGCASGEERRSGGDEEKPPSLLKNRRPQLSVSLPARTFDGPGPGNGTSFDGASRGTESARRLPMLLGTPTPRSARGVDFSHPPGTPLKTPRSGTVSTPWKSPTRPRAKPDFTIPEEEKSERVEARPTLLSAV